MAVDSDTRGGEVGFRQTARRERELAAAGLTPKLFYPIRFLQLNWGSASLLGITRRAARVM